MTIREIIETAFCPLYNTDKIVSNEQHDKAINQALTQIRKELEGLRKEHTTHSGADDACWECTQNIGIQACIDLLNKGE